MIHQIAKKGGEAMSQFTNVPVRKQIISVSVLVGLLYLVLPIS